MQREDWEKLIDRLDHRKIVFIDETGVRTNMVRMYGRGPKGERVLGKAPQKKWTTQTFVAALAHDQVKAPYLFDGPMNGEVFAAYLKKAVIPALSKGDTIIVDNLSSHRSKKVEQVMEEALRVAGVELIFLPPYSPDFNPIEQLFSKVKQLLRGAAERCVEGLSARIASILKAIPASECFNYFLNVGYGAKAM